ncbi:hypothetical protein V1511DRAFT_504555 [Dipodascopsis uninucleata]
MNVLDILAHIWQELIENDASVVRSGNITSLISLIFSEKVISFAVDAQSRKLLSSIGKALVPMAYARRMIIPTLSRCLFQFAKGHKDSLDRHCWIAELLISIYSFKQISDNVFALEPAVSLSFTQFLGYEIYNKYYELPEEAARIYTIGILASLDMDLATKHFAKTSLEILSRESDEALFSFTGGDAESESKRISLSELYLILEPFIEEDEIHETVNYLLNCLEVEFSPNVRTNFEWVICRLLLRDKILQENLLWKKLDNSEEKPRYIASMLSIASIVSYTTMNDKETLKRTLSILLAFAANNRAVVRHQSLSLISALSYKLDRASLSLISPDIARIVEMLDKHIKNSPQFELRERMKNLVWNAHEDFVLTMICGGLSQSSGEYRNGPSLTKRQFENHISDTSLIVKIGHDISNTAIRIRTSPKSNMALHKNSSMHTLSNLLQVKSRAWQGMNHQFSQRIQRFTKGKLIVLASLVDKAPNLGGICRVCDVLGVEILCLNDSTVIKNPAFQSVAVTADRWMPIQEVPVTDIIDFLHSKKTEGYSLIGLEQTDNSKILTNDLKLPFKSVLLLGREKEGIPADLLKELDFCVEINQTGIIRSMNIQTATAILVNAYAMQHC